MKTNNKLILSSTLLLASIPFTNLAVAGASCSDLPKADELKTVFTSVTNGTTENPFPNGGRGHHGWLTLVDAKGVVCAVVTSAPAGTDVTTDMSGIGHREQSARKANTSTSFSNNEVALASGNLYVPSMPGGQLFGTTLSDLDSHAVNGHNSDRWGTPRDPMIGKIVGGYLPVAGGLPLYDKNKKKAGAIGVSGDTFCTSHVVAWKVREKLAGGSYGVANVPGGVANGYTNDALIQDIDPTQVPGTAAYSPSGFGFVECLNNPTDENDGGSIDGN